MKRISVLVTSAAFAALAFTPVVHAEDDDLEVTMDVLDDVEDLEEMILVVDEEHGDKQRTFRVQLTVSDVTTLERWPQTNAGSLQS